MPDILLTLKTIAAAFIISPLLCGGRGGGGVTEAGRALVTL